MRTPEELMMEAIREEIAKVTDKVVAEAIEDAKMKLDKEIRGLSAKVAIEIAKRFEIEGHDAIINVRYRLSK